MRFRVRSKRRELNQKKNMYNELYGQIVRENKNAAFVDDQDYKLNYTFLHEIFTENVTKLFEFFCSKILGVSHQLE